MIWGLVVATWMLGVTLIVLLVHGANRVSTPTPVECSWDYQDALIENVMFRWDPATKRLYVTAITPGARFTARNCYFATAGEMVICSEGGTFSNVKVDGGIPL